MDIDKKIEEIRQKPEHERVKYVYGAVILSMLLIITLWIFSIRESIRDITRNTESEDSSEEFSGIRDQLDIDMKEVMSSLEKLLEEKEDNEINPLSE